MPFTYVTWEEQWEVDCEVDALGQSFLEIVHMPLSRWHSNVLLLWHKMVGFLRKRRGQNFSTWVFAAVVLVALFFAFGLSYKNTKCENTSPK